MRYASDNTVVRAVYSLVTGPTRFAFYAVVGVAVFLSLYFPVRDLYIAHRLSDIYSQQLAQHEEYNQNLEADVNKLMSREGIADEAHERFGYVMPGETSGKVTGLNEDGTPVQEGEDAEASGNGASGSSAGASSDSVTANSSSLDEVDTPWYCSVLDLVFFFSGPEGQTVASTGTSS